MPTEHPDTPPQQGDESQGADLAQELESIVQLVQRHARSKPNVDGTCSPGMGLLRVVSGLSHAEWERLCKEHNLDQWLGIALECDTASAVEHVMSMQEQLIFQRDHDALTQLANRRLFNPRLEAETERAIRTCTDLSLLYIDLDNFKKINDTYGHDCGDAVLKSLAALLGDSLRHYDLPCRIGGEEFAIILPSTSCWTGVMLGHRLLEQFHKEVFLCNGERFQMTLSGGVSSISLLTDNNQTAEGLLKSADKALYEAKRKGKNTIVLADSDKFARDRGSLVLAQEKKFLFSNGDWE